MKNILLVDDCADTKKIMIACFSDIYRVVVADDIGHAKLMLNTDKFDLIVLDGHLPDGSGIELASELQSSDLLRNIPIIMLTANNNIVHKIKAFQSGVDQYITKPYDHAELQARIASELNKASRV